MAGLPEGPLLGVSLQGAPVVLSTDAGLSAAAVADKDFAEDCSLLACHPGFGSDERSPEMELAVGKSDCAQCYCSKYWAAAGEQAVIHQKVELAREVRYKHVCESSTWPKQMNVGARKGKLRAWEEHKNHRQIFEEAQAAMQEVMEELESIRRAVDRSLGPFGPLLRAPQGPEPFSSRSIKTPHSPHSIKSNCLCLTSKWGKQTK